MHNPAFGASLISSIALRILQTEDIVLLLWTDTGHVYREDAFAISYRLFGSYMAGLNCSKCLSDWDLNRPNRSDG
jgi:hypothetical protein